MQDEITARPLVDILSEQLGEPAVMSGDNYVLLGNKSVVAAAAVELALATQQVGLIESTKVEINKALQTMLDTKAQELRYDNMMSVRSYAGFVSPFQAEAQVLAVWAASCWIKAGEIEAAVLAGARVMPSVAEVLAEMPTL